MFLLNLVDKNCVNLYLLWGTNRDKQFDLFWGAGRISSITRSEWHSYIFEDIYLHIFKTHFESRFFWRIINQTRKSKVCQKCTFYVYVHYIFKPNQIHPYIPLGADRTALLIQFIHWHVRGDIPSSILHEVKLHIFDLWSLKSLSLNVLYFQREKI